MKTLRVYASYVFLPVLLAIAVLGHLFSLTSRVNLWLMRGMKVHVYMVLVRASRAVAGTPLYEPLDTVLLNVQPRNLHDKAVLLAWAKEHQRIVFESSDGSLSVCSCPHPELASGKDAIEVHVTEDDLRTYSKMRTPPAEDDRDRDDDGPRAA